MKKEIIILGDIEMGGGTLTDDFISDKTLAKLIYSLCNKNVPVDLVLNGDIFAFGFSSFKHAAVIAIDCLPEELPAQFNGKMDYQALKIFLFG